jgi:cytochrome c
MIFWRAIAAATLLAAAPALLAGEIPPDARRSGYSFMGPDTRAMQDDDTSNPGMLFVLDGEALWAKKAGSADKACADCHGDATTSMKGVAARYPAFDKALARPVTLDQRINLCRANHQQAQPTGYPLYRLEWQTLGSIERRLRSCMTGVRAQAYDYGAPELVALELYLMSRARGLPMETPAVRP